MENAQPRFLPLAAKTIVSHTLTYFVMGALAFHFLHYADFVNQPNSGMRLTTSPFVILGPALQVVRGVLFAAVFYPFREVLFGRRNGWRLIAWILIGVKAKVVALASIREELRIPSLRAHKPDRPHHGSGDLSTAAFLSKSENDSYRESIVVLPTSESRQLPLDRIEVRVITSEV